jgi:hypothetical protein
MLFQNTTFDNISAAKRRRRSKLFAWDIFGTVARTLGRESPFRPWDAAWPHAQFQMNLPIFIAHTILES